MFDISPTVANPGLFLGRREYLLFWLALLRSRLYLWSTRPRAADKKISGARSCGLR